MSQTVEDLKEAKVKLEHIICHNIKEFEVKFGVSVASVDIGCVKTIGKGSQIVSVTCSIEL